MNIIEIEKTKAKFSFIKCKEITERIPSDIK